MWLTHRLLRAARFGFGLRINNMVNVHQRIKTVKQLDITTRTISITIYSIYKYKYKIISKKRLTIYAMIEFKFSYNTKEKVHDYLKHLTKLKLFKKEKPD